MCMECLGMCCSDFGFCDGEAFLMVTKLNEILDLKEG